MKENRLLNDDNFYISYISDRIRLSNDGPDKIKNELLNHNIELSKIEEELEKYNDLIYEKLEKLIIKKTKQSNKYSEYILKQKIREYFINLGYKKDMIEDILSTITLDNSESLNKEYQAKISLDISKNIDVLLNKNALEIIKMASKIEKESHSELYISIAKNREILAANLTIKLMILASKLDDEQIKLLNIIASDKLLEKNKRSVYYILKMLDEKHKIPSIYEQAKKEIHLLKQKESKIKKDNDLFWNIYKNNPNEAITKLKENETHNITPYTRIKNK